MMRRALLRLAVLPVVLLAPGCRRDTARGSPTCGIALIAAPTLIHQQLYNARAIITDAPRGLPAELPVRVIGHEPATALIGYDDQGKVVVGFQGAGFPAQGWGLLVVDDTSQRAMGVLIYESEEPKSYPRLGVVSAGPTTLNLYGVRVDWASVSNPRCPLLGAPPSSQSGS